MLAEATQTERLEDERQPDSAARTTDATALEALADALEREGFRGKFARDRATRTVNATDNSIYDLVPKAVLFPREGDDLNRIMRAGRPASRSRHAAAGPAPTASR